MGAVQVRSSLNKNDWSQFVHTVCILVHYYRAYPFKFFFDHLNCTYCWHAMVSENRCWQVCFPCILLIIHLQTCSHPWATLWSNIYANAFSLGSWSLLFYITAVHIFLPSDLWHLPTSAGGGHSAEHFAIWRFCSFLNSYCAVYDKSAVCVDYVTFLISAIQTYSDHKLSGSKPLCAIAQIASTDCQSPLGLYLIPHPVNNK